MKYIVILTIFSITGKISPEEIPRIKRYYILIAFLLFLGLILPAQVNADNSDKADDTGSRYTIGFLGQILLGYAHNDDMHDFIEESYQNYTEANGTRNVDKHSVTNMTIGFNLEGRYYLSRLALGIEFGKDYASGSVEDTGLIVPRDVVSAELYVAHYALTCYYNFRVSGNSAFLIGAGAGYYRAKLEIMMREFFFIFFSHYHEDNVYRDSSFGAHAKIEYGYLLLGTVLLHTGIQARYASFDDFTDSDGNPLIFNGSAQKASLTGFDVYLGVGIML